MSFTVRETVSIELKGDKVELALSDDHSKASYWRFELSLKDLIGKSKTLVIPRNVGRNFEDELVRETVVVTLYGQKLEGVKKP